MRNYILTVVVLLCSFQISAQDLLAILDKETPKSENIVTSTFKGTRIANGHSIKNRKSKELEFIIAHRFES